MSHLVILSELSKWWGRGTFLT